VKIRLRGAVPLLDTGSARSEWNSIFVTQDGRILEALRKLHQHDRPTNLRAAGGNEGQKQNVTKCIDQLTAPLPAAGLSIRVAWSFAFSPRFNPHRAAGSAAVVVPVRTGRTEREESRLRISTFP
jgi:hypothetical protein